MKQTWFERFCGLAQDRCAEYAIGRHTTMLLEIFPSIKCWAGEELGKVVDPCGLSAQPGYGSIIAGALCTLIDDWSGVDEGADWMDLWVDALECDCYDNELRSPHLETATPETIARRALPYAPELPFVMDGTHAVEES